MIDDQSEKIVDQALANFEKLEQDDLYPTDIRFRNLREEYEQAVSEYRQLMSTYEIDRADRVRSYITHLQNEIVRQQQRDTYRTYYLGDWDPNL